MCRTPTRTLSWRIWRVRYRACILYKALLVVTACAISTDSACRWWRPSLPLPARRPNLLEAGSETGCLTGLLTGLSSWLHSLRVSRPNSSSSGTSLLRPQRQAAIHKGDKRSRPRTNSPSLHFPRSLPRAQTQSDHTTLGQNSSNRGQKHLLVLLPRQLPLGCPGPSSWEDGRFLIFIVSSREIINKKTPTAVIIWASSGLHR